jgi:hypothetical protein
MKRFTDLSRRQKATPLVIQRDQRMHKNLLRLEKSTQSRALAFDLQREKESPRTDGVFVAEAAPNRRALPRLALAAGTLGVILFFNFFGVFGAGKATVEKVISTAFTGLDNLTAAGQSFAAGDFDSSLGEFAESAQAFREAEATMLTLGGAGAVLATRSEDVQAGTRLTTAGRLIASAGTRFASAAESLQTILVAWPVWQEAVTRGEKPPVSATAELQKPLAEIALGFSELESAAATLDLIELDSVPESLREQVREARNRLHFFLETTTDYIAVLPTALDLLGDRVPRKYLILFQNPDEIRATGGFIGSVGELTFNDGFVTDFRIRDVYEIDGQLIGQFPPPEGFGFITNNWGVRDANYHPDFPTSAAAAAWLYEQAGQGTVDGVAAITSDLLTQLVAVTGGEIQLARFDAPIAAADLNTVLSLIIETKQDGAAAPKQILDEVWTALKPKLLAIPLEAWLNLLHESVIAKEIQFWSVRESFQNVAESLAIDAALTKPVGDYLFVVDTSLSGNKSDRYTSNSLRHETEIQPDGSALDRLTLTRTHGWTPQAEAWLQILANRVGVELTDQMKEILGRGRNVDLVKVFVPAGSELIAVTGIPENRVETQTSAGKTYFMFSLTVQPGASREITLEYRVPGDFSVDYSLSVEKQAGVAEAVIIKTVQKADQTVFQEDFILNANREISVTF